MKAKVVLNERYAQRLLEGKPITVRIREGTTSLELSVDKPVRERNFVAEIIDTFFNRRPAR